MSSMDCSRKNEPKRRSKAKQDCSIMGTNNSSIVSKRSVERLYYPEPHFFRYFVKKPQRRSPLINRGYWLRMHAIETVVQRFLDEPTDKPKLVVNLGCGYDPLPFQCLSRTPGSCANTTFVDVDYPELMGKKCEVISQTLQLVSLVGTSQEVKPSRSILYRSPRYIAIGYDLANMEGFGSILENELSINSCMVLCTAEVSMTYMNTDAADFLIGWAALHEDIRFCLLEQYLPDGASQPFARQMLHHFDSLHTSLRSVHKYPQLSDQEDRFKLAGWDSVRVKSLWQVWNDPSFLTAEQRLALNDVEPFDEWEDFVLFASHYFLLEASNESSGTNPDRNGANRQATTAQQVRTLRQQSAGLMDPSRYPIARLSAISCDARRRFGATLYIRPGVLGHYGGLGSQGRVTTTDIYRADDLDREKVTLAANTTQPRMCHTITRLSEVSSLLVGGRASPDRPFSDCWLYRNEIWTRVDDLPIPIYRHCATHVTLSNGVGAVLIFGGRSNSKGALRAWLLWRESTGWTHVTSAGDLVRPRFGASMASTAINKGIVLGGMTADGTICQDILQWQLSDNDQSPSVSLARRTDISESIDGGSKLLCRIGACLASLSENFLVIGGVSDDMLTESYACVVFPKDLDNDGKTIEPFKIRWDPEIKHEYHPLLVGHSVFEEDSSVIIVGGGANCFSFGTCWNQSICTLHLSDGANLNWKLDDIFNADPPYADDPTSTGVVGNHLAHELTAGASRKEAVQCLGVETARDFEKIVNSSKPVKMERIDLGSCLTTWSLDALKVKLGEARPVVVHEAAGQHMNFQTKNFKYSTKPLGQFLDQIADGSLQYLRSLSSGNPSDQPAEFVSDFPELAADFRLPPQLDYVSQNAHSSPLRISGPVNMWLHYDVMANILCQIQGTKRVILFPPSDVVHLKVPPGESSSSINIFQANQETHPSLAATRPREAILRPGDVLFIPPLWLHAASPIETTSISINVFFRNLKTGYAAGRDVYGNRDVQAYEKGRKDLTRIVQSCNRLPAQMSRFYLERLAEELRAKAVSIAS